MVDPAPRRADNTLVETVNPQDLAFGTHCDSPELEVASGFGPLAPYTALQNQILDNPDPPSSINNLVPAPIFPPPATTLLSTVPSGIATVSSSSPSTAALNPPSPSHSPIVTPESSIVPSSTPYTSASGRSSPPHSSTSQERNIGSTQGGTGRGVVNGKRYPCKHVAEGCKRVFNSVKDLERHYTSGIHRLQSYEKSTTQLRQYRCSCGYTCPRKDNYKRHATMCTKPPKYPFRCTLGHEHTTLDAHIGHIVDPLQCGTKLGRRPRNTKGLNTP